MTKFFATFTLLLIGVVVCLAKHGRKRPRVYRGLGDLPEINMDVPQIIKYYGYPVENHDIETDDGYILRVQRIPHGVTNITQKKQSVFLQHGLVDSSSTWVMNPPHQSLAFILADAGFDVWLGNSRGNKYSNKHRKYTTNDPEFWDFSFDEMAHFDLPACIHYVKNKTKGADLTYIGHSQGTMIGFIEFGRNPAIGELVKNFIALAPVATVGHIKGAFHYLSYFQAEVEWFFKIFGIKQFNMPSWLQTVLADVFCATQVTEKFCGDIIFLMCGFNTKNLNETRIPVYVSHTPAGTSVKDVVHFAQMVKSGKFQMFDYGDAGNMQHYNQKTAPLYHVEAVKTPVSLFTADNDWLADPYDVNMNLRPKLSTIAFQKNLHDWNHLDFVWGEDAATRIYPDVINIINGKIPRDQQPEVRMMMKN
jgi:pimeloyl-ACP methyl ester carboxylesterase